MINGTLTKFDAITLILPSGKTIVRRGQAFPPSTPEDMRKKFIANGVFSASDEPVAAEVDDAAGKGKKR